jgi:hypothetical protein
MNLHQKQQPDELVFPNDRLKPSNQRHEIKKELCRVSMNKDGVITALIHWDVSFETAEQLVKIMGKAASNAKS